MRRAPVRRLVEAAREHRQPLPIAALRTAESLVRQKIGPLSAPVVRLDPYEALIVADLKVALGLRLMRYRFNDPIAWAVDHLLGRGDCFIDGGANVGLMTLVGAARVGPSGQVISCEPAAGTARLLQRNVELNRFDWVRIERSALAETVGFAEFIDCGAGAAVSSFAPETPDAGQRVRVPVTGLDELVARARDAPTLVKLDVEGAEVRALRGAQKLLRTGRAHFIVEVEPRHLERQGTTVKEMEDLFTGYRPFVIVAAGDSFQLVPWTGPWDALPYGPNLVLSAQG